MYIVWAVLPWLGFDPVVCLFIQSVSFLITFFQHTQYGFPIKYIDYFINTSRFHRIHHAKNPIYINKNFGNTLIIFDRLFGTFQKEQENEKPQYGINKVINQKNVFEVIFHEWRDIIKGENRK